MTEPPRARGGWHDESVDPDVDRRRVCLLARRPRPCGVAGLSLVLLSPSVGPRSAGRRRSGLSCSAARAEADHPLPALTRTVEAREIVALVCG